METINASLKPDDAFQTRVKHWRRALARGVGRSPRALLRRQITATAMLEAKRECVLVDPRATATDIVQITREARIARRILNGMIKAQQPAEAPKQPNTPTLSDLIQGLGR
jgi:hypothetical protein